VSADEAPPPVAWLLAGVGCVGYTVYALATGDFPVFQEGASITRRGTPLQFWWGVFLIGGIGTGCTVRAVYLWRRG
jgi:hypothetical protein